MLEFDTVVVKVNHHVL